MPLLNNSQLSKISKNNTQTNIFEDSFVKTKTKLKKTLDLTSSLTNKNLNYNSGNFDYPLLHLFENKQKTYYN